MSLKKIKADIQALTKKKFEIVAKAQGQGRETEPAEDIVIAELDGAINGLKNELEKPLEPLTMPGSLKSNNGPFNSFGEQLAAVQRAGTPDSKPDQRLYDIRNAATGLNETVPSEGGLK